MLEKKIMKVIYKGMACGWNNTKDEKFESVDGTAIAYWYTTSNKMISRAIGCQYTIEFQVESEGFSRNENKRIIRAKRVKIL